MVPAFFAVGEETQADASRRYLASRKWKRELHASKHTTLLETYSYQVFDGTLLTQLKQQLAQAGIQVSPMSNIEILGVINKSGKDEVDSFVQLCVTFLTLLKSKNLSISDVREKVAQLEDEEFMIVRNGIFLDLFEPILELYQQHLRNEGMIDFNDMILRAAYYIEKGEYKYPVDYVIIDEFQDMSEARYQLLQALKKQNPQVKFYCVGDDWQSIYRFAGSDMALFKNFEDYFGATFRSKIETTYRFEDPLISMTSKFILANPNQTPKELVASTPSKNTSYQIIESDSGSDDDTDAIVSAIRLFQAKDLAPSSQIYLIGRYNNDFENRVKNTKGEFKLNKGDKSLEFIFDRGKYQGKSVKISFITAHKSKGLEADYTILFNCNSGKYGFPSGVADDPLLSLLLSSADTFENGEERRLFYVAMTRTKRQVAFITTDPYRKSKFIKEIQDAEYDRSLACPECKKGDLVVRTSSYNGSINEFYGCTNYSYGCGFTRKILDSERQQTAIVETCKPLPALTYEVEQKQQDEASELHRKLSAGELSTIEVRRLVTFVLNPRSFAGTHAGRDDVYQLRLMYSKMSQSQSAAFRSAYADWDKSHYDSPDSSSANYYEDTN